MRLARDISGIRRTIVAESSSSKFDDTNACDSLKYIYSIVNKSRIIVKKKERICLYICYIFFFTYSILLLMFKFANCLHFGYFSSSCLINTLKPINLFYIVIN